VFGDPNGSVTVVEFFDYRCGYCKAIAPEIVRMAETEKGVRFVFKELPILPDADGRLGVSERAGARALAARKRAATWRCTRDLMAEKALNDAAIARVAATTAWTRRRSCVQAARPPSTIT
jgi:protein-disulfide isomerase